MKRTMSTVFVAIIMMMSATWASLAEADSYKTVMTIEGAGMVQKYVPFRFNAPFGNCQNVLVWQYQPAYHFFGIKASWQLKVSGAPCDPGWYRFEISEGGCSNAIQLSGEIRDEVATGSWGYREVEPSEVGIFVREVWEEKNVFDLNEEDSLFSYLLFYPGFNRTNMLRSIVNGDSTFFPYDVRGIIVGNSANGGFLTKVIKGKAYKNALDIRAVGPDDIIVFIVREHY